jgi:hypothetical protein
LSTNAQNQQMIYIKRWVVSIVLWYQFEKVWGLLSFSSTTFFKEFGFSFKKIIYQGLFFHQALNEKFPEFFWKKVFGTLRNPKNYKLLLIPVALKKALVFLEKNINL